MPVHPNAARLGQAGSRKFWWHGATPPTLQAASGGRRSLGPDHEQEECKGNHPAFSSNSVILRVGKQTTGERIFSSGVISMVAHSSGTVQDCKCDQNSWRSNTQRGETDAALSTEGHSAVRRGLATRVLCKSVALRELHVMSATNSIQS